MKLSDLAALVTVRNHISTVLNDRGVTNKDEFAVLNKQRVALDKLFVQALKEADVQDLLPRDLLIVKVGDCNYKPTAQDLEKWREVFEQAKGDPDFKIFTHPDVSVTQLEIGANSEIRVLPAVEPRSIEVSPNISITTKGQLPLPFATTGCAPVTGFVKYGDGNKKDGLIINDDYVPVQKVDYVGAKKTELDLAVAKVTAAETPEASKPIMAPEVEVAKEKPKAAPLDPSVDAEFQEALKREKEELKKQGRSNRKIKKSDDAG
jgi:hypothetical protein